jgi:polyisoprenoid-binding protein YceI
MITTVPVICKAFDLEVVTEEEEDFTSASRIQFTAAIDSLDTNNQQRDTHLKSADFFDSEAHPQLFFTGKEYTTNGEEVP